MVEGAYLSIGDIHAIMAEGESSFVAIEAQGTAVVSIDLVKGRRAAGAAHRDRRRLDLRRPRRPRAGERPARVRGRVRVPRRRPRLDRGATPTPCSARSGTPGWAGRRGRSPRPAAPVRGGRRGDAAPRAEGGAVAAPSCTAPRTAFRFKNPVRSTGSLNGPRFVASKVSSRGARASSRSGRSWARCTARRRCRGRPGRTRCEPPRPGTARPRSAAGRAGRRARPRRWRPQR